MVDYYNEQDSTESIFRILKVLSQSNNMGYFRSRYIRRMINFQWHNAFRAQFFTKFCLKFFTFLLILLNTAMLNRTGKNICYARIGISLFNAVPVFYVLCVYELSKFRKQRLKWMTAGWSWV